MVSKSNLDPSYHLSNYSLIWSIVLCIKGDIRLKNSSLTCHRDKVMTEFVNNEHVVVQACLAVQ